MVNKNKHKMINLKKYSNKKIILGIYVLTFLILLVMGVDGYTIGTIVGAYVRLSMLNLVFMAVPAFPLAIYNRIKNKTFFISKKMIKISFVIGLILSFISLSSEVELNFGHLLAPICLGINFFRNDEKKKNQKWWSWYKNISS